MRVALAQFDIAWEDRKANYSAARAFAKQAEDQGAELLVLPEMFATGFSMNPAMTAEPLDGPTGAFLRDLARERRMAVLAGLVLEAPGGKGRNSALAVGPDGRDLALYAKTHLFSYAGEERHHEAGDGPAPFAFKGMGAVCYICYDLRFPELFRKTAEQCQVVFVLASWPRERQRQWDLLLPARAVENQQYLVGVNRIGRGGGLEYAGGSAVYDPLGSPLAAALDQEALLVADLSLDAVLALRKAQPFLRDRRF